MKALIMTAQDAREFEALGGLTITKPIKPAPPRIEGATFDAYGPDGWTISGDGRGPVYKPPVKAGDIVFLREPWARLKNPTTGEPSDRVILAADSTVSEGQTSYKWASPVSMPEDAARRFAVVSKVEPIYNENVAVWSITLEAVTKSAAEAGETGALPYSDASSPEEGSNYYTYAGDMSPEDHERMAEEINQDRARLAEVQDRIIQLDSLRRELDRRAAPPEEYVPIGEEGLAIMKEEADLRNALEDAGAPAPTTADHAREKLATIRSGRSRPPETENPPHLTIRRTRRSAPSPLGSVAIAGGNGVLPWRARRAEAIQHRKRPTPPRLVFVTAQRPWRTESRRSASHLPSRRGRVGIAANSRRWAPTRPRRRRTRRQRRFAPARAPGRPAAQRNRSRTPGTV